MVQALEAAADVRNGTSGLIPQHWLAVIPQRVCKQGEVAMFAAIGQYYEAIGAIGYAGTDPDPTEAAIGEIAVRLGVKPWEMAHFRYNYTNSVPRTEILDLLALTRLGAVRNEADLIAWSLQTSGGAGART